MVIDNHRKSFIRFVLESLALPYARHRRFRSDRLSMRKTLGVDGWPARQMRCRRPVSRVETSVSTGRHGPRRRSFFGVHTRHDDKMASRVGCGPTKPAFFGVDERHRSSYHPYQGVDVACRRTKSQPYVTTFRDHTAVIGVGYQFRRDVPR